MRAILVITGLSFLIGLVNGDCLVPYLDDERFVRDPAPGWYNNLYAKNTVLTIKCKDESQFIYDTVIKSYSISIKPMCVNEKWTLDLGDRYDCKKKETRCPIKITDKNLIPDPNVPDVAFRQKVSFSCKTGYYVFGASQVRCGRRGRFNLPFPVCKPYCVKPVRPRCIVNDQDDSYMTDGEITLTCEPNYRLGFKIQSTRYCTDSGHFEPKIEKEICIRAGCSPPPQIKNGKYTDEVGSPKWYEPRAKIKYECNTNYHLEGKEYRVCTSANRFSYTAPVCKEVTCSAPNDIDFGSYSPDKTSYPVGGSVTYSCITNYKLSSASGVRTCTLNNDEITASFPKEPSCIKIPCQKPEEIEFGSFSPAKGPYYIGDSVTYECSTNYYLVKTEVAACLLNDEGTFGLFTDAPECMPIYCDKPMKPDNGDYTKKAPKYLVGEKVTFTCDENHYMDGRAQAKCLKDTRTKGKFTPSPKCIEIRCKKPMEPSKGGIKETEDYYSVGKTITYFCNVNYKLSTKTGKRVCTVNSDKKSASFGAIATCIRIECANPMGIDNGSFKPATQDNWYVGSYVTYECEHGYKLKGKTDVSTCTLNSDKISASFSDRPSCERVYCKYPGAPINGKTVVQKDKYVVDEKVKFLCDDCYKLSGASWAECQQDGEFSENVPTCILRKCLKSAIAIPNLGKFEPVQKTYSCGQTVHYSCSESHKQYGDTKTTCQPDGRFPIKKKPYCEPITCRRPPLNRGVTVTPRKTTYAYGVTIKYGCRTGYYPDPSDKYDEATCEKTGLFSKGSIKCKVFTCGKPPVPKNGRIVDYDSTKTTYGVGESVDYECDKYYTHGNDPFNYCSRSGWDILKPICNPPQCGDSCEFAKGRTCQCDGGCIDRGDCCDNWKKKCGMKSCGGRCNELGPGCSCMPDCVKPGYHTPCCDDFQSLCPRWYIG